MSKYIDETLDKLLKKDITLIVLSLKYYPYPKLDIVNRDVLGKVCIFNKEVEKLQSVLTVTTQVSLTIPDRLISSECRCWANATYSRLECLGLVSVPRNVGNDNLRKKVLKKSRKVYYSIEDNNIEAFH